MRGIIRLKSIVGLLALLFIFSAANLPAVETFILTGRIMDIDGKPVAGAEVFVYDSPITRRPADFISAKSGEDGLFRLIIPRQKLWVVARVRSSDKFGPLLPGDRHSGEALLLEPEASGELRQDFTVVDILEAARQKQKIREDYQSVTGKILDSQGKPVGNGYIFADLDPVVRGVPQYISAWTDASGVYKLYLPPGRYYMGASLIFPPRQGMSANREMVIESGKNAVAIDIQLPL